MAKKKQGRRGQQQRKPAGKSSSQQQSAADPVRKQGGQDEPSAASKTTSATDTAAEREALRHDEERREDIRGVLITTDGGRLLLPNASIAEVLSYADPEPVENTPDWLLGRIRWHGWRLPLIAFSQLAGLGNDTAGLGSKVVVLKAFGGDPKFPYFAVLTQGFPRLVTVRHAGLVANDGGDLAPAGVQAQVLLNDDAALVPDVEGLEGMIGEALAQAA